jgi:hypothetical protein
MKRVRSTAILVAVVAGSLTAVSVNGAEQSIKQLMGDNFAGLQTILVALIHSDYTNIPAQADVIRDHATRLTKEPPASAQIDKDKFLALAFALKTDAESLKSISEILIKHDKEQMAKSGNILGDEELRDALAAHYGGMVVTCVTCHSEFRHRKITP